MTDREPTPTLRTERLFEGGALLQFELGPGANFAYLLADTATGRAVVVDPAWQPVRLLEEAESRGWRLAAALLTHTHADHMGGATRRRLIPGVHELVARAPMPVYVHRAEADAVARFAELEAGHIHPLVDGETLRAGELEIECLHTPGHTPGGCCFRAPGLVLTGDTLFVGNIGNVEHAQGDLDAMFGSLRRLEALPHTTEVFPGHDYGQEPFSTIEKELRLNAYMRPMPLEQWQVLMGHF